MANTKDPGNFAPPKTGTDFVRSFPTYEACDVIGAGASSFNRSMLTQVGIAKSRFLESDGTGKPGNKRLDIQKYRCLLLTQKMQESNYRRVLDLPNYLDCRVDPPPDVSVIINEAIKEFGQADRYSPSTITKILQDIDDEMESNAGSRQSLGALASVINSLANFPQQGTTERIMLESSMELLLTTINELKEILQRSFASVGGTIENIINIVLTFVDMLFFIGDYITEQRNLRNEFAARILSQQRSIGLGDKKGVYGAYKITYGSGPSAQTIRAWCKAGEARRPQDLFLMPDGTSGAYNRALNQWKATREIIVEAAPRMQELFGDDYAQFFGACFFIAAFRKVYARSESDYYIGVKGKNDDSMLRKAVTFGNRNQTVVELVDAKAAQMFEEPRASTRIEAAGCNVPDYWVPFWEDTALGNFNNEVNPDVPAAVRRDLRSKLRDYMFAKWATANGPFQCSIPHRDKRYFTYTGQRVDTFANKVIGLYDFFDAWAQKAYPSFGSIRRQRMIDQLIGDRIDLFYTYAMGGTPAGMDWNQAVLTAFLPGGEIKKFGATTKVELGPEPIPAQFPGVKARCPGGPNDTSCLPCNTIRGRRPIGAKAIEIPTLIKWSGQRGPQRSPEFEAWKENLRQNGYPEYYIDCLTQELAFEGLPGSRLDEGFRVNIPGLTPSVKVTARQFGPANTIADSVRQFGLKGLDDVTGLRAPMVATLGAGMRPGELAMRKKIAARQGALTVSEQRQRGLLPVGKAGRLNGLDAAPAGSSSSAAWLIGGLAVAGVVYAAYRSSKKR
jgi:hypothetical protein